MRDTPNRRPHGGLLFGVAQFIQQIATRPGRARRFKVADAAKVIGEKPPSVRKILERRFVQAGIVTPVRASGSSGVEYQLAEDAVGKVQALLPTLFPLSRRGEHDAARTVVLHLQAIEEQLANPMRDLAQQAAMLETVRDALEYDLVSNDSVAEIAPGRTVRRPHLVVWFLFLKALDHLSRGQDDDFERVWKNALHDRRELNEGHAEWSHDDELNFLETRFDRATALREALTPPPGPGPIPEAVQEHAAAIAATIELWN